MALGNFPAICNLSHSPGKICSLCEKLQDLDKELVAVARQTSRLQTQRQALLDLLNDAHDRLVYRLPIEMVSRIFRILVEMDERHESRDQELIAFTYNRRTNAPLILGAVCRRWRTIAWSSPRLWSRMSIRMPHTGNKNIPDLAMQWLERTGALPLSIRLSILSIDNHYAITEEESGYILSLIDIVNSVSFRCQTLDLQLPCTLLYRIKNHNPHWHKHPPVLRHLRLTSLDEAFPMWHFFDENPGYSPTNLSLTRVLPRSSSAPWTSITSLAAENVTMGDCLQVLKQAPNITTCRLDLFGDGFLPQSVILHPNLRHLTLLYDGQHTILNYLTLPSLKSLESHDHVNMESLILFLERSSCPLKSLDILESQNHYATNEQLIRVLELTPSLRSIYVKIEDDEFVGELFSRLLKTNCSFLPKIRTIELHLLDPIFSWKTLPNVLSPAPSDIVRDLELKAPYAHRCQRLDVTLKTLKPVPGDDQETHSIDAQTLQRLSALSQQGINVSVNLVDYGHTDLETWYLEHSATMIFSFIGKGESHAVIAPLLVGMQVR